MTRFLPAACCLLVSATLGFFLYIYCSEFYFDEMHIISTDYQLRPGLTLGQVARDVLPTCNACTLATGAVVWLIYAVALDGSGADITRETTRFATSLALGCWLLINAGVFVAAAQYVVRIAHSLGY